MPSFRKPSLADLKLQRWLLATASQRCGVLTRAQQSLALPFDTPAGPCHHRRHLIGRSSLNGHLAAFTISGPFLLGSGAAPAGITF
jgi:hypothetical protein